MRKSRTSCGNFRNVWVCAQLCLTLCEAMDYTPPGSFVCGILQTGILEQVAVSFSKGSSQPWDGTQVSCIVGRSAEPQGKPNTLE